MKENGQIIDRSIEKLYPIRSRRKNRDGEEYIYKNYQTFINYVYLTLMEISDSMYMYVENDKVYITKEQPDGSVLSKKLSLHKQRGSPRSRELKPEETKNNKWKRFFIMPKRIFPNIKDEYKVQFTLNPNEVERFSGINATVSVELIE